MRPTALSLVVLLLVIMAVVPGIAVAVNNTTSESMPVQDGSDEGIGLDIGGQFQKAIVSVLMDMVERLIETLNQVLIRIFVSYPEVKQSAVLSLHQKVFQVSLGLASAAAAWIGILHMSNRVDGVRPVVYLLGAVAFGAVAPSLLRYPVELSRLTTEALAPTDQGIAALTRLSFELFLVAVIDVFLLLGTVMIFVARDVYLMLGVAMAPLIALMAVTPPFRRFADRLISIWLACLLIGPLNVVVLDLTLSLMGSLTETPHYLWGLGGIALLFGLPLILLGAGAIVFAPMTRVVNRGAGKAWGGVKSGWKQARDTGQDEESDWSDESGPRGRGNRYRRGGDD